MNFKEGEVLYFDKPLTWTSFALVNKIRYHLCRKIGVKKLKVGHAGTLDPLATGVMIICTGKATKRIEEFQYHTKEYVATLMLGATTPSYDLEKEIDRFFPHEHITAEAVENALPGFIGEQDQIAPLFSAKSVDGVRAYELARKLYKSCQGGVSDDPRCLPSAQQHPLAGGGMSSPTPSLTAAENSSEFDAAAQSLIRVSKINISELELLSFTESKEQTAEEVEESQSAADEQTNASSRINVTDNSALGLPRAEIRMACSKGTYVRAFARDLGETLDSGAHLDSLQRSRSGEFCVENALTVEQAIEKLA